MITSDELVIDFDAIKDDYIQSLSLKETPKSSDALVKCGEKYYFIEFKNGRVNKYDVMKKVYDSLLIFMDVIHENISFTRKKVNFILVYNYEKNKESIQREIQENKRDGKMLKKDEIQQSTGIQDITKHFFGYANKKFDPFQLENIFEKVYLNEVISYDVDDFKARLGITD